MAPADPARAGGEGFWVISRHEDLLRVARDPATFSSETGPGRTGGGTTLTDLPPGVVTGVMLNMSDPPVHTRIRGLVSRAFTPRAFARLEAWLRERAREIVASAVARGACDLLVDVAAELPLQTIAHLLGVPQEDRHQLFRWTTTILDYQDRELDEISPALAEAGLGMRSYGARLIERKRACPGDDVLSAVVHARLEGDAAALSEAELQAFFSLLFTAGSETTRNSIAGGVVALLEHRGELAALLAEPALVDARDRGDPALDERDRLQPPHGDARRRSSEARRSARARRRPTGTRRPTATRRSSPTPSASTCAGARTRTSRSGTGSTTASAPRSRAARSGSCSRRSCPTSAGPSSAGPSSGAAATSTRACATSLCASEPRGARRP